VSTDLSPLSVRHDELNVFAITSYLRWQCVHITAKNLQIGVRVGCIWSDVDRCWWFTGPAGGCAVRGGADQG
jgi:hypothetical protein